MIRNMSKTLGMQINQFSSDYFNSTLRNQTKIEGIGLDQNQFQNNFHNFNKHIKVDIFDTKKSLEFKELIYLNSLTSNHYFKYRNSKQYNKNSQLLQTFTRQNTSICQIPLQKISIS